MDGDRGSNYPHDSDFFENGDTLFLDTGNVTKNGFKFDSVKYITKEKDEQLRAGKLEKNDFVLTSRGTLGNVGFYDESVYKLHPKLRINSAMLILRNTDNQLSYSYLHTLLKGKLISDFMRKNQVGSAQPHITKSEFLKLDLNVPCDTEEQNKVGEFFKNLDQTITLHQQKYELLIKLKKAYLQLIFPKTGESTPKVRFADFHDNWEQRKLNEISDIYDGTHQTPKYQDEGVMFLSVENIKTLISNKFISHEAFESEFRIRPQRGDVLITRIGDVGTANVVETDENLAYYVSLALLKSEKLKPYFLQSSIQSPFVQKQIWKRTLHIAFPKKINKNEIGQVPINIPTTDEQVEIGTFFKHLDDAITLHQQKIASLKSLKQAYLQKMFV